MRTALYLVIILFSGFFALSQESRRHSTVLPTRPQQQWAEAEIGAIFHFDVVNFVPEYNWRNWGTHPPPSVFNPARLNTDQWILAARAAGAKYAILVAKHCSGFSLWPTQAHDYSVKNSPWKKGQGDVVKDFIASCKKYGLRPGIYASTAANGFCWADNPGKVQPGSPVDQQTYNQIVLRQLTELWSNYGKLFEIWFDGGVQPVEDGGPDVASLLKKLQPDAVVFQGPSTAKNLLRWIGNEDGLAPYPNWSTTDTVINANGTLKQEELAGNPEGKIWCPGETDFPLRTGWQGGWFWKANDQKLLSEKQLVKNYLTSVGHNSNMLIGIAVDTSGQVPAPDVQRLKKFGETIKKRFSKPMASTHGKANVLVLRMDKSSIPVTAIQIREALCNGERIRRFVVEAWTDHQWKQIAAGTSVGNKHIELIKPILTTQVRLRITDAIARPQVSDFSVF